MKLVILLLLASPLWGVTRYVSQSGGTGSGNHCNGQSTISVATFNSTSLSAGDINYFCGTLTTPPSIQANGTSGNVIQFIWDTGARVSVPFGQIIYVGSSTYLLFDGGIPCGPGTSCDTTEAANQSGYATGQAGIIEATANGSSLANQNSSTDAFWGCNGCTNIEIRNMIIRNLYVHVSGSDGTSSADTGTFIFQCSGTNSGCSAGTISIHDSVVHDTGNAISIQRFAGGGTGCCGTVKLFDIDFYHNNWVLEYSGDGESDLYFYNNHSHDASNWDNIPAGCGGSNPCFHHNTLHVYPANNTTVQHLYVYNNTIDGNWGTCCTTATFMFQEIALPQIVDVFNNVSNVSTSAAPVMVASGNPMLLVNNTIVGPSVNIYDMNPTPPITIQNNAIQGYSTLMDIFSTGLSAGALDYNAYGPPGASSPGETFQYPQGTGTDTFSAWKTQTGGEAHSLDERSASLGINSSGVPQSGSVLIGAGKNLNSTCSGQANPGLGALCFDMNGVARPTTAAWDIGAIQFAAASPSVSPTTLSGLPWTNTQVIATQTLTAANFSGTVTWSKLSGTQPTGLGGTCITGTTGNTCTLAGTLSAAGTFTWTIRATDGTNIVDTPFSSVLVNASPLITTTSMPNGSIGVAYSKALVTSGGTGTVTCALTSGSLPNGLSLTGSTCTIAGTPTVVNNFPFSVTPTDANGVSGMAQNLSITILGTCSITPTSVGPFNARQTVNASFSQTGCNASTFTVCSGSLSGSGLSLSTLGVLTGTAIQGTFSPTVCYDTGTDPVTINILPSVLPATTSNHATIGGKSSH